MKKIISAMSLFFLLGCIAHSEQQLSPLKTGMTKVQVDEILQDSGKWLGTIDTDEGIRNAWGYPTDYPGSRANYDQQYYKLNILFFDNDKLTKSADTYLPYTSTSLLETSARGYIIK